MSNNDLNSEIELLRRQLDELKATRDAEERQSEPAREEETSENPEPATEFPGDGSDEELSEAAGKIREALDAFDSELANVKPSTLLALFALGVLVGRLR